MPCRGRAQLHFGDEIEPAGIRDQLRRRRRGTACASRSACDPDAARARERSRLLSAICWRKSSLTPRSRTPADAYAPNAASESSSLRGRAAVDGLRRALHAFTQASSPFRRLPARATRRATGNPGARLYLHPSAPHATRVRCVAHLRPRDRRPRRLEAVIRWARASLSSTLSGPHIEQRERPDRRGLIPALRHRE